MIAPKEALNGDFERAQNAPNADGSKGSKHAFNECGLPF
jgi:hypothetical protein